MSLMSVRRKHWSTLSMKAALNCWQIWLILWEKNFAGVVLSVNFLWERDSLWIWVGNHKDPYVTAVQRIFDRCNTVFFAQTDETSIPLLANALAGSMNQSELENAATFDERTTAYEYRRCRELVFNQQLLAPEVQSYGGIQRKGMTCQKKDPQKLDQSQDESRL